MSGPKDMDWQVDNEIQRRIEEEMELERKRKEEEIKAILDLKENIDTEKTVIKLEEKRVIEEVKDGLELYNECSQVIRKEIEALASKYREAIDSLISRTIVDNRELLQRYLEDLINKKEINNLSDSIYSKLKNLDTEYQKLKSNISFNVTVDLSLENTVKEEEKVENKKEEFFTNKRKLQNIISEFIHNEFLEDKEMILKCNKRYQDILSNKSYDEEFKAKELGLLYKELKEKRKIYESKISKCKRSFYEYQEKYTYYLSLCNELNREVEIKSLDKLCYTKEKLVKLEEQIKILTEEKRQCEHYKYIVKTIDEVMEEMGYNIIASDIVERKNRKIVDSIYKIDDDSAINVYTSNNGTIMFEVTGISNEKQELTSTERVKLKENMEDFCDDFMVIRERLKAKGVVFAKENLREPSEKYAKLRVIDKEKYNVEKRKRGNSVDKKYMRYS